jgi:hypothetical protein
MTSGIFPFNRRPKIEERPMLKAIGMLMTIKPRKARLRRIPMIYVKIHKSRSVVKKA